MSIQAVAWVLEQSEATLADRLVLIAIANHIGPTGWSWPSIDAIAREAKVGRSTVFRSIEVLLNMGELAVRKRPGKSNIYGLVAFCDPSQSGTPHPSQVGTRGVPNARQRGPKLGPESLRTIREPLARACEREARMPASDSLTDNDRKRGAEFMRSVREGLLPDRDDKKAPGFIKRLEPLPRKATK